MSADYVGFEQASAAADPEAYARELEAQNAGLRASLAEAGRMVQREHADNEAQQQLRMLTRYTNSPDVGRLELQSGESEFFAADDADQVRALGRAAGYRGRGINVESRVFYGSALSPDLATLTFGRLGFGGQPMPDAAPHVQLAICRDGIHVRTFDTHGNQLSEVASQRIRADDVIAAMSDLERARAAHEPATSSTPSSGTPMSTQINLLRDRLMAA